MSELNKKQPLYDEFGNVIEDDFISEPSEMGELTEEEMKDVKVD